MDNNYFSAAYDKLRALPQVVEVSNGQWRQCLLNTLNGMVVALETENSGPLFGKKVLTPVALRISMPPGMISGQSNTDASVLLDAMQGVDKLVASWEKQAV